MKPKISRIVESSVTSQCLSGISPHVHNPLDYKQAMNDSDAIRRRLQKYLLPVIVISVLFNVPKFFESTWQYNYDMVRAFRIGLNLFPYSIFFDILGRLEVYILCHSYEVRPANRYTDENCTHFSASPLLSLPDESESSIME